MVIDMTKMVENENIVWVYSQIPRLLFSPWPYTLAIAVILDTAIIMGIVWAFKHLVY